MPCLTASACCGRVDQRSIPSASNSATVESPGQGLSQDMAGQKVCREMIRRIKTNTELVVKSISEVGLDSPQPRRNSKTIVRRSLTEASSPIWEENDRLKGELANLLARKVDMEANLMELTQRLETLESSTHVAQELLAPNATQVSPPAVSKLREQAVAQLEEALQYADRALQGVLVEPRGDAAAGAIPEANMRDALSGLTSAAPVVETRIASTVGHLKERLGIALPPAWGNRAPAQDFEVGDTCEAQDCNARWWPVLITAKNMNGTFACDVADGFHSRWREVRRDGLRQAKPASATASATTRSPQKQLEGELQIVQQQLVEAIAHNRSLADQHSGLSEELRILTTQHESLSHVHRDLTEAQAASQAEHRRAVQELEVLRERSTSSASVQAQELLATRTQHAELIKVLDEHKRELQEHAAAKESATGRIAELQQRVDEQDTLLTELPTLRAKHQEHEEQAELANSKAARLQAQLEELNQHHAAHNEMLMEQHAAQIEIQCSAAAKEAAARALDFAQLEERPTQNGELLEQERKNNAALRSQLEHAESQLENFRERIVTSEKLQKERDDMRNRLVAATRKLEDVSRSAAASAAAVQMPLFGVNRGSNPTRPLSPAESRGEPVTRSSGAGVISVAKGQNPGSSLSASSKAAKANSSIEEAGVAEPFNVTGASEAISTRGTRIVTLTPQTTTPGGISGIHTPSEMGERNVERSISVQVFSSNSPKMDSWRSSSPVNASAVGPSLSSSVRTRRLSPEPKSESTVAVNVPRGAPPPMTWQASPMRSTSGELAGPRSLPPQPAGFLMGAVPKAQVRYVSPTSASSPGPPPPSSLSAPVVAVAAKVVPPLTSPAPAAAASAPLLSPSLPARGSSSPPAYIGSAPVKAVPAKAPAPFMMASGTTLASGFVSPFAYRSAGSPYMASAAQATPQPLASTARDILQRSVAAPVSSRPLNYSADVARQQSPAFRFKVP